LYRFERGRFRSIGRPVIFFWIRHFLSPPSTQKVLLRLRFLFFMAS
jgi:hypothetical protein